MTNDELENKFKILESKFELKEIQEELSKRKEKKNNFLSNIFSEKNSPLIVALIGAVVSIFLLTLQKQSEIKLERNKFSNEIIQKVINMDSADQKKIQTDLVFYSNLGLIDLSGVAKDSVDTKGQKFKIFTSPVPYLGVNKWAIKVLNDENASKINFDTIIKTDIKTLRDLNVKYNQNSPRQIEEMQVYQINCRIVSVKDQFDGDYHIILADKDNNKIIGEIPDPENEEAAKSGHQKSYRVCREIVQKILEKKSIKFPESFQINEEATITGVGFIDSHHGSGMSENGFEIHPVLQIVLNPSK